MKKILVITQYFYPETFRINNLCVELVKRGYDVTVLTGFPQYPYGKIYEGYGFDIPYETEWNGVRINRIKMLPRGKTPIGLLLNCISFVAYGNQWVKQCTEKYDVIYVFEVSPVTVGLPAVTYKNKLGTPIYFNVQDLWPENVEIIMGIKNKLVLGIINKIVDKIYDASDRILCSSQGFVENIANRGVDRDKLVFWPQFCDEPNIDKLVKPNVYDKHKFNVVYTGNIGQAQGLETLVEAMSVVKNKNIHCYIVGDGRNLENLKNKVSDYGLNHNIHFMGKVTEFQANEYVYYADIAFLSLFDNLIMDMTIPAKLQTYMACGVPILAAVSGESADIITKAKCGIVGRRDISLSKEIEQLALFDQKELELMGKNARSHFDTNFTKMKLVNELEKMIKKYK